MATLLATLRVGVFHSYTCRSRICLIDSLRMGTHRAPSPCRRNRVPYHPFLEGSPATCRALCSVRRESDTDHSPPTHSLLACDPSLICAPSLSCSSSPSRISMTRRGGEQVHGSHKFISRHTPSVISARHVYSMGSYTPASIPHAKNARLIEI